MCFPQREEALKQHKTLSQELVNLRGELGKSERASGSSFSALGKVTALDKSALPSCSQLELHAGGCFLPLLYLCKRLLSTWLLNLGSVTSRSQNSWHWSLSKLTELSDEMTNACSLPSRLGQNDFFFCDCVDVLLDNYAMLF